MALANVPTRNAKPGAKAIKLADGNGMLLLITPAGGKLWRLKYRGKIENRVSHLGIDVEDALAFAENTEI